MTSLKGDLRSIMGTPFGGVGHAVLIFSRVTRAAFNSDSVVLQLHDRIEMPEEADGKFRVDGLDPGPIRIELEGGTVHNHGWNIDLPDEGVWSLTDLVDAQVDWSPAVIGRAEAAAREARDHADRAEAGADRVGTAEQVGAWADEASSSASAAASARSGAVTARNAAQSARDAAEGHANRAATSESNAAASETNAKQSETNAGDYAAVATTAAAEAVDAMETVSDKANVSYVDAAAQALNERLDQEKWGKGSYHPTDLPSLDDAPIGVVEVVSEANAASWNLPDVRVGAVVTLPVRQYRTQSFFAITGTGASEWSRALNSSGWTDWTRVDAGAAQPQILPPGTNVDNWVRGNGQYDGTWRILSATASGLPKGPELGVLQVFGSTGFQMFMGYTTGLWFRRIASVSGAEWSEWKQIVDPHEQAPDDSQPPSNTSRSSVAQVCLSRPAGAGAGSYRTTANWHIRFPLGLRTYANKGIRVSFRNMDYITETYYSAPVVITGVYVGKGVRGDDGELTGQFAETPVKINSEPIALPTDGSMVWTDWGADGLDLGMDTIVSYGMTSDGITPYLDGHGTCWRSLDNEDAGRLTPLGYSATGGALSPTPSLVVTAQVKTFAPKVLVVGDSHMVGVSSDRRLFQAPASLASISGYVPSISAVGGTRLSTWAENTKIWEEVNATTYDKAVVALGSNDIFGNLSLETLKENFATVVSKIRAGQGQIPIYASVVWPRNGATGNPLYEEMESTRKAFNAWLYSLPMGISGVISDDLIIDQSTGLIASQYLHSDGVHLNTVGCARIAQAFRGV